MDSFQSFYNGSDTSINPNATSGRNYQLIVELKGENIESKVVPPTEYIIHVNNNNHSIDFKENGGAERTGTIAAPPNGSYYENMTDLCDAIQVAMNTAPSATLTYNVYWDFVTHLVTIFTYDNNFELLFGTGTNKATSIAPFIGFNGSDVSSAVSLNGFIVRANSTTGVFDAIKSIQEYNTLFAWNSLRSISFTSSSIPVQQELLPGSDPTLGLQISSPILTDFQIDVSESPEARSFIQYVPSSEYRLVSLGGTTPLRVMDMNITWIDNLQVAHQVYIPPFQTVSVKILFRKKSFNIGYNNKLLDHRTHNLVDESDKKGKGLKKRYK
jgi:hypothetical protein